MSEEKNGSYKGLTEARRRANKKYNDRFVEIKVRVTPEKRAIIKDHAEKMGESATAFINRAIDEAMKRDQESNPVTYGYISTHHRMIFSLKNYLRCVIFYMSIFATRLPICMFFRYFFTHFKWSKPGLKQNCEASLSPINQDFLESYQYIAVAYKENPYH